MPRILLAALWLAVLVPVFAQAIDQEEAFREAAKRGDVAEVKALVAKGVDIDAKADDGTTALMMASKAGHTEVVRLMLEAGADVEAKSAAGDTALMAATRENQVAVVLLLLESGADVNAETDSGETALAHAAANGNTVISLILLQAGAEMDEGTGTTPLPLVVSQTQFSRRGGLPNEFLINEISPLIAAAARGDLEAVRGLIEAGADVNAQEPMMGLTALDAAKMEGHMDVVELLEKAGAKEKKP